MLTSHFRRGRSLIPAVLCVVLILQLPACKKTEESATPAPAPAAKPAPASSPAEVAAVSAPPAASVAAAAPDAKRKKWSTTNQLVWGLPGPGAGAAKSEAELTAAVKEAEATPDQRLTLALNDLAGWYRGQKKYAEAEKVYQRVLAHQRARMGESHHDLALTYNDLGVVYGESGRAAEAAKAFQAAIELWQKGWDQELRTEDEAVALHNYGAFLESTGKAAEAKALEDKADAIMAARKKAFGF